MFIVVRKFLLLFSLSNLCVGVTQFTAYNVNIIMFSYLYS